MLWGTNSDSFSMVGSSVEDWAREMRPREQKNSGLVNVDLSREVKFMICRFRQLCYNFLVDHGFVCAGRVSERCQALGKKAQRSGDSVENGRKSFTFSIVLAGSFDVDNNLCTDARDTSPDEEGSKESKKAIY